MKKTKTLLVVLTCLIFLSSFGFSNGLNLNGLGSRAIAMGGAFVALANDISAIFWNPAGIALFDQTTAGVSGDFIIPSGDYQLSTQNPMTGAPININTKLTANTYLAGLAAVYTPINEQLVAGFGVYTPSGLGAEWDGADFAATSYGSAYNRRSKIGVLTISPSLAYKVSDNFSIGATLNINYGMFDLETHGGGKVILNPATGGVITNPFTGQPIVNPRTMLPIWDFGQQEMSLSGWGYGATIGMLVKPADNLSIGATFRTPTKISFEGTASISQLSDVSTIPNEPLLGIDNPLSGATIPTESDVEGELTWPMWIGFGIAYAPIENLIISADVQYTNWKKIDVISFDFTDVIWQGLMATEKKNEMEMHWDDRLQLRVGLEYLINNFAIRAGYYNDPAPSPNSTMNILVPNYDFNSVSLGFGINLNGLLIDFAAEYLMGKERNVALSDDNTQPGTYNMNIFAGTVTVSQRFGKK